MSAPPFADATVAGVFAAYPELLRSRLLELRRLIFATAAATPGVNELCETLKWNEPAYLTARGSTVRLGPHKAGPDRYALYFNCNTSLLATFRSLFPGDFQFDGDRALVFSAAQTLPDDALRVCIAAALTYHRNPKMKT